MKKLLFILFLFSAIAAKSQTIDTAFHSMITCKIGNIIPSRLDSTYAVRIGINTGAIDFRSNTVTVNYVFFDINGKSFPDYDSGYFTAHFPSYTALLAYLKNGTAFIFPPLGTYLHITYQ